jgi:predicted O-linked N-acetylglucosamine transferase (SPINDLY family)
MALTPAEIEALVIHGYHLHQAGKRIEAEAYYHAALGHDPGQPDALHLLGLASYQTGDMQTAIRLISKAIERAPHDPQMACDLGLSYQALGDWDHAISAFQKAIALDPLNAGFHQNLANCRAMDGQSGQALSYYSSAVVLDPGYAEVWSNLGSALHKLGRHDPASKSLRRALRVNPNYLAAASNLIYAAARGDRVDGPALRKISGEFNQYIPSEIHQSARQVSFEPPERPFKIGYVSGDFRTHPVGEFMAPIMRHHDRVRFRIHLYTTSAAEDDATKWFRQSADHWSSLAGLNDDEAAALIRKDKVDVLIDLSGHTAGNRLGVFARRAAPVQAHYLGYFGPTGLDAMDYWIGDHVLIPQMHDNHFTENVWRLDRCFMAYGPPSQVPLIGAASRPAGPKSCIRFGSFNAMTKICAQTLDLWASLLHRSPGSTLLLKSAELKMLEAREFICTAFLERGIGVDRLILRDTTHSPHWLDHMASYADMDIALDTVGSQGGVTTTCDALWMGVPVICLLGDRMATRLAATLLTAAGFSSWIAQDAEAYISKALTLSRELPARASIRSQIMKSELCDTMGLTRALEAAYSAMLNPNKVSCAVHPGVTTPVIPLHSEQ